MQLPQSDFGENSGREKFRVEAFNAFNHVKLGLSVPGTNGKNSSDAFGVITSARDPRQIQLGLKLRF